jgi:hypothetical protein
MQYSAEVLTISRGSPYIITTSIPSQRVGVRPDWKALTAEEKVCVELVRLDGYITILDMLLLDGMITARRDRRGRSSSCNRLEDVRRNGINGRCRTRIERCFIRTERLASGSGTGTLSRISREPMGR